MTTHLSPLPLAIKQSTQDWSHWFLNNGAQPFRVQQLLEWVYYKGCFDPNDFSNMPKNLRTLLKESFDWAVPTVDCQLSSVDGSEKLLYKLHDNRLLECVIMPYKNRVTLCVSSQIGCKMACTFCQTGKMGLARNLSMGEILIQLTLANGRLLERDPVNPRHVTHVVFMGMGEPLDNYDAVVEACRYMIDPRLFHLSKHRVTISTSGLVPQIKQLGQDLPVALSISLHNADNQARSALMPINRQYPLPVLKQALLEYPVQTRHGITFEYVMIKGVNDSLTDAKKLVSFLHGLQAKVNLIPMNPHPGSVMTSTDQPEIRAFQAYLSARSIPAPVRYSRGQDVSAACGQLAAKKQEELDMQPRLVALKRHSEARKKD